MREHPPRANPRPAQLHPSHSPRSTPYSDTLLRDRDAPGVLCGIAHTQAAAAAAADPSTAGTIPARWWTRARIVALGAGGRGADEVRLQYAYAPREKREVDEDAVDLAVNPALGPASPPRLEKNARSAHPLFLQHRPPPTADSSPSSRPPRRRVQR
ncbi:hypothetical protein VTO73DRAFT_9044 [Trametes versicolor]